MTNNAQSTLILKSDLFGPFVPFEIKQAQTPIKDYQGFSAAEIVTFAVTFIYDNMVDGYHLSRSRVENPEVQNPTPPMIKVLVGLKYNGGAKAAGKLIVRSDRGSDVLSFDEFTKMARVSGLDVGTIGGRAVMEPGLKAFRPLWFKVAALEGRDGYPPRNVLRAWAESPERFQKEAQERAAALVAAMSEPSSVLASDDAESAGQPAAPSVTLLD